MHRPSLPGGRKWSDYIELDYAVGNPGTGIPLGTPKDVASFFLLQSSEARDGAVFHVNGKVYVHKEAWRGLRHSKEHLRAVLTEIAIQQGYAEEQARTWIVTQELRQEAPFHKFLSSDTLHEEIITQMIFSFIEYLKENSSADFSSLSKKYTAEDL